jgi:hypothetical protein
MHAATAGSDLHLISPADMNELRLFLDGPDKRCRYLEDEPCRAR